MRPAECGEKVVQHIVIRQIDHRDAGAPYEPVTVKQVIVADGNIEKIACLDTSGVVVVVLRIRRRHLYERGTELRSWADPGYAVGA